MSEQDWLNKDFYKTLGVSKNATADEIKKSYRKLARKLHPDQNKDNPQAEARFKEVTAAYEVLSKKENREKYDAYRQMGAGGARFSGGYGQNAGRSQGGFEDIFSMFGGGGQSQTYSSTQSSPFGDSGAGMGDIFGGLFGGAKRRQKAPEQEATAETSISFQDALNGAQIQVSTDSGYFKVQIPAGINDGQSVKVKRGGVNIRMKVNVGKDPVYELSKSNVKMDLPVRFDELVFGGDVEITSPYGEKAKIKIPEFTKADSVLRVKGKGVKTKSTTGDLLVKLKVQIPQKLSTAEKKSLSEYAKIAAKNNPRNL